MKKWHVFGGSQQESCPGGLFCNLPSYLHPKPDVSACGLLSDPFHLAVLGRKNYVDFVIHLRFFSPNLILFDVAFTALKLHGMMPVKAPPALLTCQIFIQS